MIATIDPVYESAAKTVYELNQDRFVRDAIIAYEAKERRIQETIAKKDATLAEKESVIAEQKSVIASLQKELQELRSIYQ